MEQIHSQFNSLSANQLQSMDKINKILQKIELLGDNVDTFISRISGCSVFEIQENFDESK